jgi:hypothetical protein
LKLPVLGFAGAAHLDPLRNFLPNRFAADFKTITQRKTHGVWKIGKMQMTLSHKHFIFESSGSVI